MSYERFFNLEHVEPTKSQQTSVLLSISTAVIVHIIHWTLQDFLKYINKSFKYIYSKISATGTGN